jgi:hypothetical protein
MISFKQGILNLPEKLKDYSEKLEKQKRIRRR